MVQLNDETTAAAISQATPAGDAPPKVARRIPNIDVNAVLFRAANEFTSNEDTRYYLQGVYVQPHPEKGALLVATDGHRLVGIHDETGVCDAAAIVIVETRALAGVKIDKKKPEDVPRLRLDGEGHVVVGTYRSLQSSIIDATYPDYRRVVKPMVELLKKGVFSPASFNHEYLAGFSHIAALLSTQTGMCLISTSEADPALVLFAGAPHAFGIIMPMRTTIQHGMPAFMRAILEPPPPLPEKTGPDPEPVKEQTKSKKKRAKPRAKPKAKRKIKAKGKR